VLILAFILAQASVNEILAQSPVKIRGTVVSRQTGEPVPFVHVYTKSYRHGTTTDAEGNFMLVVEPTDTLAFSSVGYELFHLHQTPGDARSSYEVNVELMPKIYQLDPVNVTAYPSIEQFKHDVLKLEITEEKYVDLMIPRGYALPPEGPGDVNLNPSITFGGPATALYNAFSREGKERRKLKAFGEKLKDYREMDAKYNLEVVKQVTDLDDEAAKRFMEWCKFEEDFILKSSAYDLAVAMLKCLDDFAKADTLR
jgi:hypothetical protein